MGDDKGIFSDLGDLDTDRKILPPSSEHGKPIPAKLDLNTELLTAMKNRNKENLMREGRGMLGDLADSHGQPGSFSIADQEMNAPYAKLNMKVEREKNFKEKKKCKTRRKTRRKNKTQRQDVRQDVRTRQTRRRKTQDKNKTQTRTRHKYS